MKLITYDGRTQNLRDWSKEIGISWRGLQNRLAKGWPLEQALSAGKGEFRCARVRPRREDEGP